MAWLTPWCWSSGLELRENKFLLTLAAMYLVICCGSPRKLMQLPGLERRSGRWDGVKDLEVERWPWITVQALNTVACGWEKEGGLTQRRRWCEDGAEGDLKILPWRLVWYRYEPRKCWKPLEARRGKGHTLLEYGLDVILISDQW